MQTMSKFFILGGALAITASLICCETIKNYNPPGELPTTLPDLAMLAGPTLTAVTPARAVNNTSTLITLTGTGFRAGVTVTVGGAACTNDSVASATQLTCTVPAKAATCGRQAVVVTNDDDQTAMGDLFSFRPAAVIFGTPTNLTSTGMDPIVIVAADFNKDGKLDLASANRNSDNVSIYLNNGSGGFAAATNFTVGTQPTSLALVDLNKDTNLDLVITNAASNNISFLAGDGIGGFAAAVNTTGTFNAPQGVVTGDFNKDGNPDVAVANTFTTDLVIFTGNGAGVLTEVTPVTVGSNARYLAVADLNKDGNLDVVTPNVSSDSVSYRPGNGNATFGAGMNITVGVAPPSIAIADFNSDGLIDVATANRSASVAVRLATCN